MSYIRYEEFLKNVVMELVNSSQIIFNEIDTEDALRVDGQFKNELKR
ncbi:hypothetical protein [Bacillus safensis]|nr:hypothetical protein [Bacillus safensis]